MAFEDTLIKTLRPITLICILLKSRWATGLLKKVLLKKVVFKRSVKMAQDATVQRHVWDSETIDTDAHMDVDIYI